jgi:hypothetical protein
MGYGVLNKCLFYMALIYNNRALFLFARNFICVYSNINLSFHIKRDIVFKIFLHGAIITVSYKKIYRHIMS